MATTRNALNWMTALLLCGSLGIATAGEVTPDGSESTPDACAADVDGDNSVGFHDMHMVLRNWGSCRDYQDFPEEGLRVCAADLTSDGWIGMRDLLQVFDNWGACEFVSLP